MKFELLSPNLVIILEKMLENSDLVKLVNYATLPLSQSALADPTKLINIRIFPFPSSSVITEEITKINVWYPDVDIKSSVVENSKIYFDIICHDNLYLFKDDQGKRYLRLFEIANRITKQFDDESINTVGVLKFRKLTAFPAGNNFQGVRLIAEMMTIGK